MNDVEIYFQATMGDHLASVSRMGALSKRGTKYLKHPTRKGEQVGWYGASGECGYFVWEFTPSFVKECLEASKNGRNALSDYISMIENRYFPRM